MVKHFALNYGNCDLNWLPIITHHIVFYLSAEDVHPPVTPPILPAPLRGVPLAHPRVPAGVGVPVGAGTGTAVIHVLDHAPAGVPSHVHGIAVAEEARDGDTIGRDLVPQIGTGVETETGKETETGIEGGATRAADEQGRTK